MNVFQAMQMIGTLRNDPSQIGQMLLSRGRINQSQFDAMRGMNPSQMGNYLMNNGILNQQQVNQISQMMRNFMR